MQIMPEKESIRPKLSVVVPVYNERDNILRFLGRLEPILEPIGSYEILFCADPSSDGTEQIIEEEIKRNPQIGVLVFSRRFGQPAATMAGIFHCTGETCVIIDVDLQDPPEVISELYTKLQSGYEVVYAKRRSRKGETLAKLCVSYLGYKVIHAISEVKIPRDVGDFRIISRRVIEELRAFHEIHGFLRGLVAFVGFRQTYIEYDRDERTHGKGKYNRFLGSLKIGLNGLISYSNFLLSISFSLGLLITACSSLVIVYMVIGLLLFGKPYPMGTVTIVTLIVFLGGVQLLSIGILGEYIGRIYDQAKGRPQYIIDRTVNVKRSETVKG